MPIRGYTQMHRTATGSESSREPSGQVTNVPYSWVATQPVHHSAFWPPTSGLSSQPEQDLFTAQLQIEFAKQFAKQQGNRSGDLYRVAPAYSALSSGLSSLDRSRISSLDLQPPQMMAGSHEVSFPQAHLGDHASAGPQDLQSANWMSSVGVTDNTGFQYLQASKLYAGSQTPQALNLERQQRELALLQSELARVQNDLSRAEREIARQKSLRETERSEFSEAKERLKHSWANDREDFARVKTSLKTKNAEHHTQSGRLSQHLKDSEACNRALRELVARNGIPIPVELEVNQVKRLAGHNCIPKTIVPPTDPSWTAQTSLPQMIPKEIGDYSPPRNSLDSYLQHVKQMQEQRFASKSLPEIFGSHMTLNTEDCKTESFDNQPQDKQH